MTFLSSDTLLSFLPSTEMQNLTGKVRKSDSQYFDYGGLADIYKGVWSRDDGSTMVVAIKVIRAMWSGPEHFVRLKRRLLREGKHWSKLDHPNVVPFYGISYDSSVPDAPCLICPYYPHGNVSSYLRNNSSADRLHLVAGVAAGLSYLHSTGVGMIHGDVKAANILVDERGGALLTDFGLSQVFEHVGYTTRTVGGTSRWMAPELVAPEEEDEDRPPRLTAATDVWAFSMTVLEIYTNKIPFHHLHFDTAVILAVMRGSRPPHHTCPEISDEIWAGLTRCWEGDPTRRPSMHAMSLFFDVVSALKVEGGGLSESDVVGLLDAAQGTGKWSKPIPQAKTNASGEPHATTIDRPRSPRSSSILRALTLNGDIHLSPKRRSSVSGEDAKALSKAHSRSRSTCPSKLRDAPYPCHWPGCRSRFSVFRECQAHEMRHVMLQSG